MKSKKNENRRKLIGSDFTEKNKIMIFMTANGRLTGDYKEGKNRENKAIYGTLASHRGDKTDFIDFCLTGKNAENALKYTKKGDRVTVSGSLVTYKTEKDGKTYNNSYIAGTYIEFLETKNESSGKEETKPVDERVPFTI